jgi:hypothetical protein
MARNVVQFQKDLSEPALSGNAAPRSNPGGSWSRHDGPMASCARFAAAGGIAW